MMACDCVPLEIAWISILVRSWMLRSCGLGNQSMGDCRLRGGGHCHSRSRDVKLNLGIQWIAGVKGHRVRVLSCVISESFWHVSAVSAVSV